MRYLAVGGLTLDDIVAAGGAVHRRVPGGNALYAALGAALWSDDVGILSFVGEDYPRDVLGQLEDAGVATQAVSLRQGPSVRLWILYQDDGARQIHYQHPTASLLDLTLAVQQQLPQVQRALTAGAAIHLAALPVALQNQVLADLRGLELPITLDSIEARGSVGGDLASYWQDSLFEGVIAFLPSRDEFEVIRGVRGDAQAVWELASESLRAVLIKDGAAGVHVYDVTGRTHDHVPAIPVDVVDPTGAGDAFCGGFLVGLSETGDVVEAARRATVSASFVVEAVGGLHMARIKPRQVHDRLRRIAR